MTTRSPASSGNSNTTIPRAAAECDVCTRKDGFRGLRLHQCRSCGVRVHDLCYGLPPSKKPLEHWECWACRAVGKKVEGRHMSRHVGGGTRVAGHVEELVQTSRPTECVLCSVDDGIHAMHPLYDAPKKRGRQVLLPAGAAKKKPVRLAWVHTLCGMVVSQHRGTGGCVYGCDRDGNYETDHEDEHDSDDDDDDDNKQPGNGSKDSVTATHHFVLADMDFVHPGAQARNAQWIRVIREHRELKCFVCGPGRPPRPDLRIPVQCCAGDEGEYAEFKKTHGNVSCFEAVHVGCAQWGSKGDKPQHRRVWFYPGQATFSDEDGYDEPVGEVFCSLHALELFAGMKKKAGTTGTPTALPRKSLAAVERAGSILQRVSENDTAIPSKMMRSLSVTSTSTGKRSRLKRSLSETISPKRQKTMVTLPAKAKSVLAVPLGVPRKMTATKAVNKPKVLTNGNSCADKKPPSDATVLDQMISDIEPILKGTTDQEQLKKHVQRRRAYWKREAGIGKAIFKENWIKLQEIMLQRYPHLQSEDDQKQSDAADQDADDDMTSLDLDDEEAVDRHSATVEEDPWAYLWLPNAEPFAFGEWWESQEKEP